MELATVSHHFIDQLSITDDFSAADYERYALNKLELLYKDHDVVIICGGTGLYLKALTEGLDEVPTVPQEIRNTIREKAAKEGIGFAQEILKETDPSFAATESFHNTNRVLRALEVYASSGKTISSFQKQGSEKRPFNIIQICLELPKEELHERIECRVDQMMAAGLLEEAKTLVPFRKYNALNTVGYKEIFSHLDGEMSLDTSIALIKQHTRQYAKRQKTWFRKIDDMLFSAPDLSKVLSIIDDNTP